MNVSLVYYKKKHYNYSFLLDNRKGSRYDPNEVFKKYNLGDYKMSKQKDLSVVKKELFEIKLYVKDEEVACSKDLGLWQAVFSAINKREGLKNAPIVKDFIDNEIDDKEKVESKDKAIDDFANIIGIDKEALEGACGPSKESPYIHLDEQYWEALKRQTPERGRGAISSSVLCATLLTLWFKYANLGKPSLDEVAKAEKTINIEDKNSMRSLRTCKWLQIRNEKLVINPAEISKAIKLCKAYCTKKPLEKQEK